MGNELATRSTMAQVQSTIDNSAACETSYEARGVVGSNPPRRTNKYLAAGSPEAVTRWMCERLGVLPHHHVLEPSAGSGGMVKVIREFTDNVTAVELNEFQHSVIPQDVESYRRDFLRLTPGDLGWYDFVVMCPPKNSDEHIRHAAKFVAGGGKLIALVQEQNITLEDWPTYNRTAPLFHWDGVEIPCGFIELSS